MNTKKIADFYTELRIDSYDSMNTEIYELNGEATLQIDWDGWDYPLRVFLPNKQATRGVIIHLERTIAELKELEKCQT